MKKTLHKILCATLLVLLLQMSKSQAQAIGDYRSLASGAWAAASGTWEAFDGTNWVDPTTMTPALTAAPPTTATVTVRNGHTVTIAATTQVKKMIVEAGATFATDATARGIRLMDSLINYGTVGGTASGARINVEAFNATFGSTVVITGTGTYYLGLVRGNQVNTKLELVIDADVNLYTGLSGFYTTTVASLGNTANQFDDDVTITIRAGRTVTAGSSATYLHCPSGTSTILVEKFGNYTYNINGTMTLAGTSCLIGHDSIAASVVTINVNGKLQTGTALRGIGAGSSGIGTCVLNIGTNGVVDGSRSTNMVFNNATQGKNAFFNIAGNGKLIQKTNTTSSSTATFNIGVNGIYSPVKLTNSSATDTFSVGVQSMADNGLGVVKKQWNIAPLSGGGANVTVALGWQADDNGTGFNSAGALNVYTWDAVGHAWTANAATINTGTGTNNAPYFATVTTPATTFISGYYSVGNQTPSPLPLHFISLKASLQPELVNLSWITENEVNTSYFIVEKSLDNLEYQAIGTVKSNNTLGSNAYSFNDNQLSKGVVYYRLKQVDIDGKFTYSIIVAVRNNKNIGLTLSPNPVINKITVSFDEIQKETTLRVIGITGRQIIVLPIVKGAKQAFVDVSSLPKGQYTIVIDNELGKPSTKAFTKL